MNALTQALLYAETLARASSAPKIQADKTRQAYHLMAPVGFLNDPNGLCHFNGRYHVFYQYAPTDASGGLKYWGHYSSPDLIRWTDHPPALCPDTPLDCHGAYSGTALAQAGALTLFYTGNVRDPDGGRAQNVLCTSTRDGRSFSQKRLVLSPSDYPAEESEHVRDPKVFMQDGRYYMLLGARDRQDRGHALVYESADLAAFRLCNVLRAQTPLGYMWECPDTFLLDGKRFLLLSPQGMQPQGMLYQNRYQSGVLAVSGALHSPGCALDAFTELDRGFDFYAPQTLQAPDGRTLLIGWMAVPDAPYGGPDQRAWQHCLTLPRELSLRDGRVCQSPARELATLRRAMLSARFETQAQCAAQGACFEACLSFEHPPRQFDVLIRGRALLEYREGCLHLRIRKGGYGRTSRSARIPAVEGLQIFSDQSSLEIFVDGECFTTRLFDALDDFSVQVMQSGAPGEIQLYDLAGYAVSPAGIDEECRA